MSDNEKRLNGMKRSEVELVAREFNKTFKISGIGKKKKSELITELLKNEKLLEEVLTKQNKKIKKAPKVALKKDKNNKEFDYNYLNESLERTSKFIEKTGKLIKKYNKSPSKAQKEAIDKRINFIKKAPKSIKEDLNLDEFTVNTKTRKGDYFDDYKKYLKKEEPVKKTKKKRAMIKLTTFE